MCTRGPLDIGADCWFGARVTVLDAASIGARCVIGAGAVVTGRCRRTAWRWACRPGGETDLT